MSRLTLNVDGVDTPFFFVSYIYQEIPYIKNKVFKGQTDLNPGEGMMILNTNFIIQYPHMCIGRMIGQTAGWDKLTKLHML